MNIFDSLTTYAGKWKVKSKRAFEAAEIEAVEKAEVVSSQYNNSVCFFMKKGGQSFIPLSQNSSLTVGDTVDMTKASLLTLEKSGESDIIRVEV